MNLKKFNITEIIYNYLLRSYKSRGKKWWDYLWNNFVCSKNLKVTTLIHGHPMLVNSGYSYPLFSRMFKEYNNPLLELAYRVFKQKQEKISLIDVGAAVGDTFFLIDANIKNAIDQSICIDGDPDFYECLKFNLNCFSQVNCINALLSDKDDEYISGLVRIHPGTASAQGITKKSSISLDTLFKLHPLNQVDIIKIDVDGYDGVVLNGARNILRKFKPYIIFEWHPILYKNTNNNVILPYEVLYGEGYDKFVFFTKYGIFSHFMFGVNHDQLYMHEKLSLRNVFDYDWHYDVIALHKSQDLDASVLAECAFSRRKISPY